MSTAPPNFKFEIEGEGGVVNKIRDVVNKIEKNVNKIMVAFEFEIPKWGATCLQPLQILNLK